MTEAFGVLFVVGAVVGMLVWKKQYWLAGLIGGGTAVAELGSKLTTDNSISENFWEAMAVDPTWGWIAGSVLLVGAVALVVHLWWKQLKKKFFGG